MSTIAAPAFALILGTGLAAAALAEGAAPSPDSQQQAAPDPSTQLPSYSLPGTAAPVVDKNPVPDAGTTGQATCIDETGDYQTDGKAVTFVACLRAQMTARAAKLRAIVAAKQFSKRAMKRAI